MSKLASERKQINNVKGVFTFLYSTNTYKFNKTFAQLLKIVKFKK